MLLSLLFACGTPPPTPPVDVTSLPNGAAMPTIVGERELVKKSSAIIGLLKVRGDRLDQTIGWGKSKRTAEESARHERSLVFEALDVEDPGGDLVTIEVAGSTGAQWRVDGGTTQFMGASFDLCGQRIALATFGASADEVATAHAATLAGAVCSR